MDSERPAADTSQPVKVLVVDDDEDTRQLYFQYLKFSGFIVLAAADGIEAINAIPRERPDVIVLDLAMPGLTGLEVLETLKHEPQPQPPVVVLSGQQMKDAALAAGARAYLEKPCLPATLLREVARAARERRRYH